MIPDVGIDPDLLGECEDAYDFDDDDDRTGRIRACRHADFSRPPHGKVTGAVTYRSLTASTPKRPIRPM